MNLLKLIFSISVMAMVMACAVSYGTATPAPAMTSPQPHYGLPTPAMTAVPVMATASMTARVIAPNGLRLRDRPDAAGPVDSIEQAIMPYGEIFTVMACRSVFGEQWAYGAWRVDRMGWAKSEFLEPDPCN